MGVHASMSISLLRDGRLWGLIACHHYAGPHLPPYGVRAAAEFLGSTLSLRLVDRVEDEELRTRLAAQAVLAKLTAATLNEVEPLTAALLGAPGPARPGPRRRRRRGHRGAQSATRGTVPDRAGGRAIAAWAAPQDDDVVDTECLSESSSRAATSTRSWSAARSVMLLPDGQYVLWFRGETARGRSTGAATRTTRRSRCSEGDSGPAQPAQVVRALARGRP